MEHIIQVKLDEQEYAQVSDAAHAAGIGIERYVINTLLAGARSGVENNPDVTNRTLTPEAGNVYAIEGDQETPAPAVQPRLTRERRNAERIAADEQASEMAGGVGSGSGDESAD